MEILTYSLAATLLLVVLILWLQFEEIKKLRGRALRAEILLRNLYLEAGYEEENPDPKFNYGNLKGMFAHGTEHPERKD